MAIKDNFGKNQNTARHGKKDQPEATDRTIIFDNNIIKDNEDPSDSSLPIDEQEVYNDENIQNKPISIFKENSGKKSYTLETILNIVKIAAIALVIFIAAAIGAVFGLANAYLGTTPELDMEELNDQVLTSFIYDANGDLITTYSGIENREYAKLEEIPDMLQKAVIATEDVRFYHHSGVDLKRLFGAFVNNLSNSSVSGGSTITQQLIKNQLLSSERSYKRKIQEASLALELETKYSKDQILESYLNTIPLGGTNYGVKAAARDYFGKSLDELTLRECACLAGVTQYPYALNPRRAYYVSEKSMEMLNERIELVLNRMYTAGYITLSEMNAAKNDKFDVIETSTTNEMYEMPHFVEYAVYDVVTHFLKQRGLEDNAVNRAAVENELRTRGYNIYTTVDPEIQKTIEDTFATYDKYPQMKSSKYNSKTETLSDGSILETPYPQAACVLIDQKTGNIKAMVGSRIRPTIKKSTNRAYQSRMPVGSSIKPIAVYGPAMDKGAGLGTVVANIPVPITGWTSGEGYPTSSQGTYGPTSLRTGIKSSLNIVASRLLSDYVGLDDAYNYLMELNINSKTVNKDIVGLALGSSGITMLELTSSYAAIANGGIYREPLSFTKVEDSSGRTILDASEIQEVKPIYKKSTAYMLVDAMKTSVKNGTSTKAKIDGITVAGKTGTVQSNKGMVFAGITGYYTSAVWLGHDEFQSLADGSAGKYAAPLWKAYMSKILEGKEDMDILPGAPDQYGVSTYEVCSVTGLKPGENCPTVKELFATGTEPSEICSVHSLKQICAESGHMATEYCPEEQVSEIEAVTLPEDSIYWQLESDKLKAIFPNLYTSTDDSTCPIHTKEWYENKIALENAVDNAKSTLKKAETFMSNHGSSLNFVQRTLVQNLMDKLKQMIAKPNSYTPSAINTSATSLKNTINSLS